jgi:DNA-binding HxlR family transcriptional regulator
MTITAWAVSMRNPAIDWKLSSNLDKAVIHARTHLFPTEVTSMKPAAELTLHDGLDCRPVRDLLERIGSKWTMMVIMRLRSGPMRFNGLKRDIGTISPKVLTETLRDLEYDGLVKRIVTPVIPPRVDYQLTELGLDLLVPINALGAWAIANKDKIDAARRARARATENMAS